jgi:hypothetical protein
MAPNVTIAPLRKLLSSRQTSEPGWRATARADLLRALAVGGCTACTARSGAEQHWMSSFVHETNADPDVRATIRAARGLCAPHLRLAHEQTEAPFVLAIVHEEVAAARIADLGTRGRRPTGECPVCTAAARDEATRLHSLCALFGDMAVRVALRDGDGLCVPHWTALAAELPPAELPALLGLAAAALADPSLEPSELLTGQHPDLVRRTPLLREALTAQRAWADDARAVPAAARVLAEAGAGCCAVCRSAQFGATGYLSWLAGLNDGFRLRLEPGEYSLCATHLGDLSVTHPQTAEWIAADQLVGARDACAGAIAVLDGVGPRRDAADDALTQLTSLRPCPACHAGATTAERTAALLAAGLHDAGVRAELRSGHGLCAEHAPALSRRAGSPLPVEVLRARLELLRWELAEASRRRGWRVRHEPSGPEGTAWLRAPSLLCGDAYLGLPPPATF